MKPSKRCYLSVTALIYVLAGLLAFPSIVQAQQKHSSPAHKPAHHKTTKKPAAPAKAEVKVWVNTKTGIYHYPGMRWYGNTKEGQFMSEKEAIGAGYRATHNGQ